MSEQPTALRLAAQLEACPTINYKTHASELRRLHAEVEEQCRLNGMGSEREARLRTEVEQLTAYMDALNARVVADAEEIGKLRDDAERYRWLAEHPNEWRIYRKHGKHKRPFRMMRDGDPWGQSFATPAEAIDAAKERT